jgi:hypothetical protein
MEKILATFSLAVGIGIAACQDAGAVPGGGMNLNQVATAASSVQQAQFVGRRTRHGVVKCYRELVVGPYRCHHFWNW